jgi:hypothetical protein
MYILRHIFFLLVLPSIAMAQPSVPATIESVNSGGYWATPEHRGRYRVVMVNEGYEHVYSRVFVEWVADPRSSSSRAKVIKSTQVPQLFSGTPVSLSAVLIPLGENSVEIKLDGVNSITQERVSASVVATHPGQVSVVACG